MSCCWCRARSYEMRRRRVDGNRSSCLALSPCPRRAHCKMQPLDAGGGRLHRRPNLADWLQVQWFPSLTVTNVPNQLPQVVADYNADPNVHGILVQLPLPKHIDEQRVLDAISIEKVRGDGVGCSLEKDERQGWQLGMNEIQREKTMGSCAGGMLQSGQQGPCCAAGSALFSALPHRSSCRTWTASTPSTSAPWRCAGACLHKGMPLLPGHCSRVASRIHLSPQPPPSLVLQLPCPAASTCPCSPKRSSCSLPALQQPRPPVCAVHSQGLPGAAQAQRRAGEGTGCRRRQPQAVYSPTQFGMLCLGSQRQLCTNKPSTPPPPTPPLHIPRS